MTDRTEEPWSRFDRRLTRLTAQTPDSSYLATWLSQVRPNCANHLVSR
jgi:hypothetical protein